MKKSVCAVRDEAPSRQIERRFSSLFASVMLQDHAEMLTLSNAAESCQMPALVWSSAFGFATGESHSRFRSRARPSSLPRKSSDVSSQNRLSRRSMWALSGSVWISTTSSSVNCRNIPPNADSVEDISPDYRRVSVIILDFRISMYTLE